MPPSPQVGGGWGLWRGFEPSSMALPINNHTCTKLGDLRENQRWNKLDSSCWNPRTKWPCLGGLAYMGIAHWHWFDERDYPELDNFPVQIPYYAPPPTSTNLGGWGITLHSQLCPLNARRTYWATMYFSHAMWLSSKFTFRVLVQLRSNHGDAHI